jgi:hypothetical protein
MLCPPPPTLNPVTIFEATRLPHRANPSRAAGSFFGPKRPSLTSTSADKEALRRRPGCGVTSTSRRRRLAPAYQIRLNGPWMHRDQMHFISATSER